MLSVVLRVKYN